MPPTPRQQLEDIIHEEWENRLRENPTFATACGDHRYNDRLPGMTPADFERRQQTACGLLARLRQVERAALEPADALNYDVLARELTLQIDEITFGAYYFAVTKSAGLPVYLPDIILLTPFNTPADLQNYIQRLGAFPRLVEETVALMDEGLAKGFAAPRPALAGVTEGFTRHASGASEDSLFYAPFKDQPEGLRAAGRLAVQGVQNAYRRLAAYLEDQYLPKLAADGACFTMPRQADYYTWCVRRFTTLDLTPQEVHQTGLAEVARIRAEMEAVMKTVGFNGSLRAFSDSLRSDPRFFVHTPEELMKEVALLMKRIEGELPRLFRVLPRTPFGLRETPDYIAPNSTSAYYFPPAGDGSTAGFYYVNTYDLASRPLYEYEALSMHEAVPGHHLQIALQYEMTGIPEFRKYADFTSFVDGWALYAERLGLEMGFYTTPYTNFGRLVYEMWRAARLVVDTGLHAFGWSREQAIAYLAENTALSMLNIATEVDRYISWPGQALAYKIGELKIRALRQKAEAELGPAFNVREFHAALLENGGIPLSVLEDKVSQWIQSQRA